MTATLIKEKSGSSSKTETKTLAARQAAAKAAPDKSGTPKERQDPEQFRSRLKIYPRYRWKLFTACSFGFFVLTSMIFTNMAINAPWAVLLMPIASIAALFLLIPPSEEWEYKPWQNAPRKIEQSIFDQ